LFLKVQTHATEVPELDAYDARILAELQRDARTHMAELGRQVHLSQPAVTERVRKLEMAGYIKGYRAWSTTSGWATASGRCAASAGPNTPGWSS
jgi:Mn-dependent DtxR family transcriptional regulator